MPRREHAPRRAVAAVELAVALMFFLVPMMIGVWELGRLIQVQQIVSNSARAGARLAAQGNTINAAGNTIQIMANSGNPSVYSTVYQYLIAAGLTNLTTADVNVAFAFTPASGFTSGLTDPYQGAMNQPFTVTVTVQWNKVRWVNLGLINPTTVSFTANWQMLVDTPFTVDQNLPEW